MKLWHKIQLFFCRHDWRVSRFQALVLGQTSYRCTKCGKYETRHDH